MCEEIQTARIIIFFIIFSIVATGVLAAARFCKKNNIDFNTFSGMFEMYRHVFKFKNKSFSILILFCIYGSALLGFIIIAVSLWAEKQGCVFPTQYS